MGIERTQFLAGVLSPAGCEQDPPPAQARRHLSTVREVRGDLAEEFWVRALPHFVLLTEDRHMSWDFLGAATGYNP